MKTIWRRALAAVLATVAGLAFGNAPAAHADPSGAPAPRVLNGVGSDTTQDINNGLAAVVKDGSGNLLLGSWDATPQPSTIKPVTTTFPRPDGSGAGISALRAAKTGGTYQGVTLLNEDLQFARSSSGAAWKQGGNGAYAYVPLAVDAVSFAVSNTNSVIPINGVGKRELPLGTTIGQDSDGNGVPDLTLKNIYGYHRTDQIITLEDSAGTDYTVGAQGTGAQIVPFVPQVNSGTRKFFAAQILGSGDWVDADRADWAYTKAGSSVDVQEHDGSVLQDVPGAITPFSIASWIAQNKKASSSTYFDVYSGVSVTDRRHGADLGYVNGEAPYTGTSPSLSLNTSFPLARPVFTVVKVSDLTAIPALADVFQGGNAKAYTAKRPGSLTQLVITDFGFGDLTGGVTIGNDTYNPGDTTSYTVD